MILKSCFVGLPLKVDYHPVFGDGSGILGKKRKITFCFAGNEVVTMIDYIGNIRFFMALLFYDLVLLANDNHYEGH